MRLKTIWTIQSMPMKERLVRSVDWAAFTTATKLPSRVRYWATLIAIGKASGTGPYAAAHPLSMPLEYLVKHLEGGPK